ncbi:hypothetical protein [Streptomyces albus]|uniref:hypothetical protein n=1 Tax=Streptomyces albus TaxID=1888 RepID=UPI0004C6B46B|nr:hypothetical protein [Streptomyces albus]
MLASVPIAWLWLLAAASTVLSSCVLGSWIPFRKFRIGWPVTMVVVGAATLVTCQAEGFGLAGGLVMHSFGQIGLTLGLLPQRKLFREVYERWRRGEPTEHIRVPRRHTAFLAVCFVGVSFAGFALTR